MAKGRKGASIHGQLIAGERRAALLRERMAEYDKLAGRLMFAFQYVDFSVFSFQRSASSRRAMDWRERIRVDPKVCHGKPCIQGTRVMVSVILDNLAAGESHESIRRGYNVEEDDIQAALRYAAELARDRFAVLPTGTP